MLARLREQIGNLNGVVGVLSESSKKLQKQQAAAEKEFRSVAASLDPVIRAQQSYDRSTRALDEALKRNIVTEAEHNRLLGIAKTRYQEASNASVSFGQRAERSIGGLLTNLGKAQFLIGGLGMLASGLGLGAAIEEAREAEREIGLLEAQIKNLPATSSITAELVQEHARQIGEAFAFDGEEVTRAERALIRFGVTSDSVLQSATQLSADVARTLGIGLTEAAQMVGKALQQPGEGMKALKAAGLALSENQIALAQNLAETGRQADAQRVVIGSLSDEVEGTAARFRDSFDGALAASQVAAGDLAETVGLSLIPGLTDLINVLGEIAGSDLYARNLRDIGSALGGVATGASKAFSLVGQLNDKFNELAGFDFGDVWTLLDPLHLGLLVDSIQETSNLSDGEAELATAIQRTADAERARAAAARASREEEGETLAMSRKSHADMVEITARWSKETATLTAQIEREDKAMQDLFDSIDPLGKALREAAEKNELLERRFAAGKISADAYAAGLAEVAYQLEKVRADTELTANDVPLMPVDRNFFQINQVSDQIEADLKAHPPALGYIEITSGVMTPLEEEFDQIQKDFASNMQNGLLSAGETFLQELRAGGDDVWQHLGENLEEVLMDAAFKWLTEMLLNQAKIALAGKANSATDSSNGATGTGALASAGWVGAVAAIFVAFVQYAHAQRAERKAHTYSGNFIEGGITTPITSDGVNYVPGGQAGVNPPGGEQAWSALEQQVAESMGQFLLAFQATVGNFTDGIAGIELEVRRDGEKFKVTIADVLLGEFNSFEEAMVAGVQAAFQDSDLAGAIDPVLRQVVDNYKGDAAEFLTAIGSVRDILDEVSGLTDIEIALRDLPQQTDALSNKLQDLGVSIEDADIVSAKWEASQRQRLRDQITGHQQTAEEELAQHEREAQMFNAQMALDEAKLLAEKASLEAQAEVVQAQVALAVAGADAQLSIINAQLSAYNQVLAIMQTVAPIDLGEIRLPGRGGGGGHGASGQSKAQQRAQAFEEYLDNMRLDGLTEMQRKIEELNRAAAEQARAAGEAAGGEEALAAARAAAFARLRADFLEGRRVAGLTEYQRGLEELNAAFAEQALLNPELVGGEEELAAARAAGAAQLREDLIDTFGLPLEQVRDRLQEMKDRLADFALANAELLRQYEAGEISAEEFAAAIAAGDEVMGEFRDQMLSGLLELAVYFTDAMGDAEESARIRVELAEMEWDFKRAEFRLTLAALWAVHALSDADFSHWNEFLNNLPEDLPAGGSGTGADNGSGGYDTSGQDDQLEAQRDLISALEDLADLQRDLWASNLSPLNAEEQTQFLAGQIQDAYNQAQASQSPEDIRAFQDLIRQYLGSYQDAYGSTGGYTAEFLRINDMINALLGMGGIGGVVPGPGMMGGPAGTGTPGWRPTPGGQGVVLPFERSGGPSSPFVVESPALAAILQETNRRLVALEQRMSDVRDVTARGNEQAASRFFTAGRDISSTVSGKPRIQRRGA